MGERYMKDVKIRKANLSELDAIVEISYPCKGILRNLILRYGDIPMRERNS